MIEPIKEASFVISSPEYTKCPKPDRAEYAFIGRSNVGKSSLINMLTGVKGLAKTSAMPGKTQLINHFLINNSWFLVDLPGYGFARISKAQREVFESMIKNYLLKRNNLINTFILIDSRHAPQAIDLAFIEWMGTVSLPFSIVFTKSDKLGKTKLQEHTTAYKNQLLETWEELPPIFITSSEKKLGRDEILKYIGTLHPLFTADR
ncbi:MAG: putative GTP-binding protein EngB [Bacteroidota bacterium]|jgi:GTP-binding protein